MAFVAFGDVIAAALLQTGRFRPEDAQYVWGILAGSSVGLLASTMGRLYSAAYYALGDTRTPLRFALIRVVLVTALGYVCAILVPPWLGVPALWGAAGLTASAGIAGWVEFLLLRRGLARRIGATGVGVERLAKLWGAALAGAAIGWLVRMQEWPVLYAALARLGPRGPCGARARTFRPHLPRRRGGARCAGATLAPLTCPAVPPRRADGLRREGREDAKIAKAVPLHGARSARRATKVTKRTKTSAETA